ncbi:MAG: phage tail protein [Bacillaceae bacterium]
MSNYSSYYVDSSLKPFELKMNLYRMNRKTRLGEIAWARNTTLRIKFSGVHELTFTVPFDVVSKNKRIRNPRIDELKENFKIKINYGGIEEWFVITNKKKVMDEGHSLQVQCHSLAHELNYQYVIDYEVTSKNCLEVLTDALKGTNWTVGYINQEFLLQWRQFDVSSQTILSFIDEICETFKATVIYDTVNRKVNLYKEEEVSIYKGFVIEYGQYLSSLEDELDVNSIITRLRVSANDKASINAANPTGQNYIDDFSVYLYPFERDRNRNVLKHSTYLEDEVCHAILDYNEKVNKYQNYFSEYLSTKKSLRTEKTSLENEKQILDDDLQIIIDDIAVYEKNNQSTAELIKLRDSKEVEVNAKKSQIDAVQSKIDAIDEDIKSLNEILKFENNFTGDILEEINNIIKVEVWSDNNQIDDESYYYAAVDYLSEKAILPVNLSISIVNFFRITSEHKNWNRMSIGDIVRIRHDKLGINVKTKISEIEFNFDSDTINLTISNTKRPENDMIMFSRLVNRQEKMNTDYNKRKKSWINTANNFNERNDRISATPTTPTFKKLSHKANDNGSVDLTLDWEYPDSTTTQKDEDNIDGFYVYLYSSTSPERHIFGSYIDEKDVRPLTYATRTFTFPSVPANRYYSIGIQAYRQVDTDVNKNGTILSDIVSTNPYQPEKNVVVNGNVNGQLNGMTIISGTEKPDPTTFAGTKAVFINTEAGSISVKKEDDEDFKESSVGDASSVSGYNINTGTNANTIPIRNSRGQLPGDITGSATKLDGKSAESFITTDKIGKPNGVVPLDSSGKIPAGYVTPSSTATVLTGSYYGDGMIERPIFLSVQPKLIKIQSTNPLEPMLYIVSVAGGFKYVFNGTNMYLEGEYNVPSTIYGKLTSNGFTTGSTNECYGNKSDTAYYWEAIL